MPVLRYIDVVGLEMNTNGRSCEAHDICGRSVQVGDILVLKNAIVTIEEIQEGAVAAIKLALFQYLWFYQFKMDSLYNSLNYIARVRADKIEIDLIGTEVKL
jgi:hypothetical protein